MTSPRLAMDRDVVLCHDYEAFIWFMTLRYNNLCYVGLRYISVFLLLLSSSRNGTLWSAICYLCCVAIFLGTL